ncbi:hypothetical protein [Nocardia sp. NPDC057353]|uniref:hypothetical protein n=1 Tax=Nocardia sp. NPDC057353 TaxID=3346104 RepID=UPI00363F3F04
MLNSLEAVHTAATGGRPGRWNATKHLNLALFVSLAAEFQGYCRDLHDDAAIVLAGSLAPGNDQQIPVVLNALVRERRLDRGNASPAALGSDFAVLGLTLWPTIHATYPTRGKQWNSTLTALNEVRNAVAHSDGAKLREARRSHPLHLGTFRRWRRSLDGAAAGLDRVVGAHLVDLTGTNWDEEGGHA